MKGTGRVQETQIRLPSEHLPGMVEISQWAIFLLLEETFGRKLTPDMQRRFERCRCAQDVVTVIAEDWIDEFLRIDLWRLCQLYVALLGGFRLARPNTKGYDALDCFELHGAIKAGTIQVKHGGISKSPAWIVEIASKDGSANYGALVYCAMRQTRNPSKGHLLVIPREDLQPVLDSGNTRIVISKNKFYARKGAMNRWWEYHLVDHSRLRSRVGKYIHGEPVVSITDLPLFADMEQATAYLPE